jgi:hypothetical protein
MFELSFRMTVPFWLAMAILGQNETSPALPGKADSGASSPWSVCLSNVDAERSKPRRSGWATASQPEYHVVARYVPGDDDDATLDTLPTAIASELRTIDAARRAIETGGPIERWRFDGIRGRYEALSKKGSGEPAVEEAVRLRLARLVQLEQAAKAAATFQAILAESHRRDRDVVELKRRLRRSAAGRSRAYEAVGYMQVSAQKVDGQKVFVLIGKNGGTVAFLRIPPGLDPDPMLARKVGVRGVAHYDEDLQSRLITVRTLDPIESRR